MSDGTDGDADVDTDADSDADSDADADADEDVAFDPLLHYDGCFNLVPSVSQRCAFGMVNYSFDTVCFQRVGPALTLTADSFELTQTPGPDGASFEVEFAIPSGCTETYRVRCTPPPAEMCQSGPPLRM